MKPEPNSAGPERTFLAGACRFFTHPLLVAVLWAIFLVAIALFFLDAICTGPFVAYAVPPGRGWLITVFSVIQWLGDVLKTFFPWPFVVLALALYFSQSSVAFGSLAKFFRLFKGVKTPYLEITLSEEARKDLQQDANEILDSLKNYRKNMDREIVRLSHIYDMPSKLERAFEDHIKPEIERKKGASGLPENFRCTIHVPDPMFERYLYQLLNYYPSGGGAGRSLSDRYGIIGKVWRSGLSQVVGQLLKGKKTPSVTEEDKGKKTPRVTEEDISEIAREWGLTKSEARAVAKKVSYACAIVTYENVRVGIFYMDSTDFNAFSPSDDDVEIVNAIKHSVDNSGLAKSMYEIQKELEKSSPRLVIEA